MKKIFTELLLLIGIGSLLWVAFTFLIDLPSHPVLLNREKEKVLGDKYTGIILTLNGFEKIEDAYIDSVFSLISEKLSNLAGSNEQTYNIILVRNEMINAFALPGGNIIVTTGLIKFCESPAEIVAILAHEAGHIVHRHILTRLIKELGLELFTSGNTYVNTEIAKTIISSGYNRKQEEEADIYACELLEKAGIEPRTLASVFRRLDENPEIKELAGFEIISSHPNLRKRIKYILSYNTTGDYSSETEWFSLDALKEKLNELY